MRGKIIFFILLVVSFCGQYIFAQISGKIQEFDGQPAMGAKVSIKGTQTFTKTNDDGEFELPIAKSGDLLEITNLEEETQEVVASNNMVFKFSNTKNNPKTKQIESVVVLGFGKVRDVKDVVGTATVIKGDEVSDMPVSSFEKALSGRVSGLVVSSVTGQPGGVAQVRLRGVTSVNGNNSPIYIVDGVRISSGNLISDRNREPTDPSTNILANINPDDIESYTILKDAAATSLYGADAGAGVIVITTKQGKQGKPKFTINLERGINEKAVKGPKALNAKDWNNLYIESVKNFLGTGATEQDAINFINNPTSNRTKLWDGITPSSDWGKIVEADNVEQLSANLGLSGGTDNLTYTSSLNYFSQDGIVRSTEFDRLGGRIGTSYKATDRLRLNTSIDVSYSKQNSVLNGGYLTNPLLAKYFLLPTYPIYNSDGSYNLGGSSSVFPNGFYNPGYILENDFYKTKIARFLGAIQAEYKIYKNLNYVMNFAPEYVNLERDRFNNSVHGLRSNSGGNLETTRLRIFNWNLQNIVSYNFTLGGIHNFDTRIIQEAYKSDYKYLFTSRSTMGIIGLYSPDIFIRNVASRGNGYKATRVAYAGNIAYNYERRFFLDATLRREALNNFGEGNKWGNFWSLGAAYDIIRQSNSEFLKIKTSYGELGNRLLNDDMNSFSLYAYDLNYNDAAGGYIYQLGNKDFTWEKIRQFDVGWEFSFFKGRFNASMSYFHKKTKDLIMPRPVSLTTGLTNKDIKTVVLMNIGDILNEGIEVDLGTIIIKSKAGFTWGASVNFTYIRNEVTRLPSGDAITAFNIVRQGKEVNSWYLRKWAGVNPDTGQAQWYINGKNGAVTTFYNQAQREIQGTPFPKINAGLTTDLSYKGIYLSATLSGAFGHKIFDRWSRYMYHDGEQMGNYSGYEAQRDYWTPENRNSPNPKPVYGNNSASNFASTRFLYKGDFLRLRDITIGYNFPKNLIRQTGINSLKIYLRGANVLTYQFDKKLRDLDFEPEQSLAGGGSNLDLPVLRTYILGINIGF